MLKDRMLFLIADTLGLDLVTTPSTFQLKGEASRNVPCINDIPLKVNYRIVDSFHSENREVSAVILQIAGDLHVLAIADTKAKGITLAFFDANKLEGGRDFVKPLKGAWHRVKVYKALAPAIFAVVFRQEHTSEWVRFGAKNEFVLEYLAAKASSPNEGIVTQSISDKYRTTGPRGV